MSREVTVTLFWRRRSAWGGAAAANSWYIAVFNDILFIGIRSLCLTIINSYGYHSVHTPPDEEADDVGQECWIRSVHVLTRRRCDCRSKRRRYSVEPLREG